MFRLLYFFPPWHYTTHSGCVFYSPLSGFSLLEYEVTWSHTATRHSRQDSSEWMISPSQRPLPDNTQHSQQTNIHAPGGIRTHDRSRRAAVDPRLRPRGYWDRRLLYIAILIQDGSWRIRNNEEIDFLIKYADIVRCMKYIWIVHIVRMDKEVRVKMITE